MKYVILGDPVPLARARHGNKRTWDAQKAIKFGWAMQLESQHTSKKLYKGPLLLDVDFYFEIPKTHKKKYDSLCGTFFVNRPDLDNCIKFVCDVASGILYTNDSTICSIISQKYYDDGNGPRTEFSISELSLKEIK